MKLIAGTDKGLIVYEWKHKRWDLKDILFVGLPVSAFHQTSSGDWWVALNHKHWGPKIYVSTDKGESFSEKAVPRFKTAQQLRSIWSIKSKEDQIYLGTEPAALFRSNNGGESFEELTALSAHESRPKWQGGGKGSMNPFLHSIIFNPSQEQELIVGISCAGVFRSEDNGDSWTSSNDGLKAFFLPNAQVEVGHDPHSMIRHTKDPNVIWQQNHCGIYRSLDNGKHWTDVSDPDGKAFYGFDLVIDENDIDVAWVIPAQSDDQRIPHQGKLAVYKTMDGGNSWHALRNGLPQEAAFDMVLRAAFDKQGGHLAFGTNNGNLYVSEDLGENWIALNQSLSSIRTVDLI